MIKELDLKASSVSVIRAVQDGKKWHIPPPYIPIMGSKVIVCRSKDAIEGNGNK